MVITKFDDGGLTVRLWPRDTEAWATRPGNSWPCSVLRSRRVWVEFDAKGDLVDMTIDDKRDSLLDGGRGPQDCPLAEFSACLSDHIASRFLDHPAIRGVPTPI